MEALYVVSVIVSAIGLVCALFHFISWCIDNDNTNWIYYTLYGILGLALTYAVWYANFRVVAVPQ